MAKVEFTCNHCEKTILIEKKGASKRKFCSRECSSLSQQKQLEVKCDNCGVEFMRKQSRVRENNFCSKQCADDHRRDKTYRLKNYLKYKCLYCDKTVEVMPCRRTNADGSLKKFCSKECSYSYHKERFVSSKIEIECSNCGKKLYRTKSNIKDKNYCSVECMGDHFSREKIFSGENSGTWNGGKLSYYGSSWGNAKRKCRERDNYTCQDCGITEEEYGMKLSVHHIVPFIIFKDHNEANDLDNLVAICEPCHRKRHSGDNHPSKFSQTYSI